MLIRSGLGFEGLQFIFFKLGSSVNTLVRASERRTPTAQRDFQKEVQALSFMRKLRPID